MNEQEIPHYTGVALAVATARPQLPCELPRERPVSRLGRVLAAVPSLGPTAKAWTRIGFSVSQPFDYLGCRAFDVTLNGASLRFLTLDPNHEPTAMSSLVAERLLSGAGILGWSWACNDVALSREIIEANCERRFPPKDDCSRALIVPRRLTPGAATVLEPLSYEVSAKHRNCVERIDHMVVTLNDVDKAAGIYENAFGLHARRRTSKNTRYAFLKVGRANAAVIELVGPARPTSMVLAGHAWGITFRSPDLDQTVKSLRKERINISDPHPAVQGGRITGFPMQLGGIQIAFIGE